MPKQITGIQITDNGNGTCNVQIGPSGYTRPIGELFERDGFDPGHVLQNIRLAAKLSGCSQPSTFEFTQAVNRGAAGINLKSGTYYLAAKPTLVNEENQTYHFGLASLPGKPEVWGFEVPVWQLVGTSEDSEIDQIWRSIGSFLRVGNYSSLTPAAIAAIAAYSFWVDIDG